MEDSVKKAKKKKTKKQIKLQTENIYKLDIQQICTYKIAKTIKIQQ